MTDFVDDGLSLRAELLAGGVDADSSQLDAQPDFVLLCEGLRDACIPDQSKPQRACQSRGLTRYRSVGRVDAEAAPFERHTELREGLRPEGGDRKDWPSVRLGNIHLAGSLLAFELCDLDGSSGGLRRSDSLIKRRHLCLQRPRTDEIDAGEHDKGATGLMKPTDHGLLPESEWDLNEILLVEMS